LSGVRSPDAIIDVERKVGIDAVVVVKVEERSGFDAVVVVKVEINRRAR
jgi:hypothetical protein